MHRQRGQNAEKRKRKWADPTLYQSRVGNPPLHLHIQFTVSLESQKWRKVNCRGPSWARGTCPRCRGRAQWVSPPARTPNCEKKSRRGEISALHCELSADLWSQLLVGFMSRSVAGFHVVAPTSTGHSRPTCKSNQTIMSMLKINDEDIYEDIDDNKEDEI